MMSSEGRQWPCQQMLLALRVCPACNKLHFKFFDRGRRGKRCSTTCWLAANRKWRPGKPSIKASNSAARRCAISRALAQSPHWFQIDVRQEASVMGLLVHVQLPTPARAPGGETGLYGVALVAALQACLRCKSTSAGVSAGISS